MMSIIAMSFPEVVILRKVLKPKLIAVFVGVVAVGITIVGLFFNAITVRAGFKEQEWLIRN